MLRLAPLLCVALAIVEPTSARADMTATYQRPGSAGRFVIEVASDGDVRAGEDQDGFFLWTGGVGYEVRPGPGGPAVTRTVDTAAAQKGRQPPWPRLRPWLPVDTVTMDARTGRRWFIDGAEHHQGAQPLVISGDPSLAALASGWRRYDELEHSNYPDEDSPERTSMRKAIAQGLPIEIHGERLVSVSNAAIPPARFSVPAEPIPAADVHHFWEAVREATVTGAPPTPEQSQRERDRSIKHAVWAAGRLWLLTDHGTLSSVAPGERVRRVEPTPFPAAEICVKGGAPVLLSGIDGSLSHLAGRSWSAMGHVDLGGEHVRAISCSTRRIVVVTERGLAIDEGGRRRRVALSAPVPGPVVRTVLHDVGDTVLLGTAAGEWGGVLERIDAATGSVSQVPRLGGPINGVAPEPGRRGCLVATVGLVHFFPSGQIVEVCGDAVRRLYYKPYTMDTHWPADVPKLPFQTVPFYGLVQAGDVVWIAGGDGLYAVVAGRPIAFRKMPEFQQVDGVDVSFAIPGLAMVRTDIDAHVSLGGGAPLLAAR